MAILFFMGGLCLFFAFFYLPLIIIKPEKFAGCLTLASIFFMTAIALIRGPWKFFKSLFQKEQILISLSYQVTTIGTFYFSLIKPSYLFAIWFGIA